MPIPTFPLGKALQLDDHEVVPEDNRIRTPNDAGPPQMRRRFTASMTMVRGSLLLTAAEYNTFTYWYKNTVADGSLTFTWNNPFTGLSATMAFRSPPRYRRRVPGATSLTLVALDLEIRP